ncbi:15963_t:CDS:2, partial [Racocetra persica]
HLEPFGSEMIKSKDPFKDLISRRILPVSSYETVRKNLNIEFGKENIQLFRKFLEDNAAAVSIKNHPAFIASILSAIGFVAPSKILISNSNSSHLSGHGSTILAIPLPNFVSYSKGYNPWEELLLPSTNPFTHSNRLEIINEVFYRYLNGEALLRFEWKTYG